ncbi:hypothetical protein EBZ37_12575 [bacterium]|nr:hypothetical protein [bacterium]
MSISAGLQNFETCFARLAFDLAAASNSAEAMNAVLAAQRATLMEPLLPYFSVVSFDEADAPVVEMRCPPGLEIPRRIAPAVSEFLVECVRNWKAHGRQSRAERKFAGKSETAKIFFSVSVSPYGLRLEFHDDGAGIRPEQILSIARTKGLLDADELSRLESAASEGTTSAFYYALFSDRLTTKATAELDAGRGMGLSRLRQLSKEFGGEVLASQSKPLGGFMLAFDLPCSLLGFQVMRRSNQLAHLVLATRVESSGFGAWYCYCLLGNARFISLF